MSTTKEVKWLDKEAVIDEIYYKLDDMGDGDLMDMLGVFDTVYPMWEDVLDELNVDEDDLYEGSYGDIEFECMQNGEIDVQLRKLAERYLDQELVKRIDGKNPLSPDQQLLNSLGDIWVEEAYEIVPGNYVSYNEEAIKISMRTFVKEIM